MAEICRLSQVTEAVVGVEKPLVKKAKIHIFFEPYGQLSIMGRFDTDMGNVGSCSWLCSIEHSG